MKLIIVGNVQTVLMGNVTEETLYPFSVEKIPYALGGAVIPNRSPLSLGETLVYEGTGHIFTVEESWEERKQFKTPFLMGIERQPKNRIEVYPNKLKSGYFGCAKAPGIGDRKFPNIRNMGKLTIADPRELSHGPNANSSACLGITEKQSLNSLYLRLIKDYQTGFAITGTASFSHLSVAYLKRSPIYGENINTHHGKYWEQENLTDCTVQLFGVVLTEPNPQAFYINPNEKEKSPVISHTHVLIPEARHLLTTSILTSASFWIEEIDTPI
ncbi:MAG: hypothetical protein KBC64_07135 [Simkaniaceae bacterium]|nr:hypothetical protein [Simkaniaceae bacterium]